MRINYHTIIFSCFLWIACEKKINLPVPKIDPIVVIEAILCNKKGESKVSLSKTEDINNNGSPIPIHNAIVKISEEGSNVVFTFKEKNNSGIYYCNNAIAQINKPYRMSVNVDGKIYESIEKSNTQTNFLCAKIIPTNPAFNQLNNDNGKSTVSVMIMLNNNGNTSSQVITNIFHKGRVVASNQNFVLQPHETRTSRVINIRNINFQDQDSLIVNVKLINKEMYRILESIRNNARQFSATPTTPFSNISNGALGYFQVCISKSDTIKKNDNSQKCPNL